jgi:hypothetical protein
MDFYIHTALREKKKFDPAPITAVWLVFLIIIDEYLLNSMLQGDLLSQNSCLHIRKFPAVYGTRRFISFSQKLFI